MRVISGKYRGRRLISPEGSDVRPTTDRVKEAIFSIVADYVEDSVCLDLFSGSGNLGIEALSRGASYCYFADISKKSIELTRKNIDIVGVHSDSLVMHGDYRRIVSNLVLQGKKIDLVLIDAPYNMCEYGEVLSVFNPKSRDEQVRHGKMSLLTEDAVIVLERDRHSGGYTLPQGLCLLKTRRYGQTEIDIIVRT